MAANLLTTYKQQIKELKLVPTGGGAFEVSFNGDLVYSKLKTGEFPDESAMVKAAKKQL